MGATCNGTPNQPSYLVSHPCRALPPKAPSEAQRGPAWMDARNQTVERFGVHEPPEPHGRTTRTSPYPGMHRLVSKGTAEGPLLLAMPLLQSATVRSTVQSSPVQSVQSVQSLAPFRTGAGWSGVVCLHCLHCLHTTASEHLIP